MIVFSAFLKEHEAKKALIICVNDHGIIRTGEFFDTLGEKPFIWDADLFCSFLERFNSQLEKFDTVSVVFAQCYGKIFGDAVINILMQKNFSCIEKIRIGGISDDKTFSLIKQGNTVATSCEHISLSDYLEDLKTSKKQFTDDEAKNQPPDYFKKKNWKPNF